MRTAFWIAVLALIAAPVEASVYAVQQRDGSWKVSKYDDGDATIKVTYRDLRKTIKVVEKVKKKDFGKKIYMKSGKDKVTAYEQADQAWKKAGTGEYWEYNGVRKEFTNERIFCGSSCYWPEPGEEGRPDLKRSSKHLLCQLL